MFDGDGGECLLVTSLRYNKSCHRTLLMYALLLRVVSGLRELQTHFRTGGEKRKRAKKKKKNVQGKGVGERREGSLAACG